MGYLSSDGFQGTNTTQKDNSVWAMTVRFSLLSEHATSKRNAGVLALGLSKNHQPIFDRYMNEVSQLHTPKLYYF